jgi:mono/diheme cytochrome c family protein
MPNKAIFWFLAIGILALSTLLGEQDKGDADKGNEVFDEQCASCHSAYSDEKKKGPSLQGLFGKDRLESNGKPANERNIRDKIESGGKGMPAFKKNLSASDESDLIAYLKTL